MCSLISELVILVPSSLLTYVHALVRMIQQHPSGQGKRRSQGLQPLEV
jgi:hypothetical protein